MTGFRWLIPLTLGVALVLLAEPASAGRLGAPLPLMLAIRDRGDQRPEWDWLLPGIARDEVGLTLRLRRPLDAELEGRIEATGARLRRDESGRPAHLGPIYGALVPWSSLRSLASLAEVGRIELARPPGLQAHLDISVPEIQAPELWAQLDDSGRAIDGAGVIAADFDSGIDVFHPLFFRADGGLYDWIDVNGDGRVSPGVDAVDLDGDGEAGEGEGLGLLEGALSQGGGTGWVDGFYDADLDWLYNDEDGDGERDYGPEAGYTDLDPSFGELLFIIADADGDGALDPGESLVGLGTSKLLATLVWPDVVRYLGVDLIETPVVDPAWEARYGVDTRADHGTGVSSVLGGGWAGSHRRVTGVAPGVELVLIDFNNELGLAVTLPWALSLGARVGAHPYGHKIFSFLDGSSNDELAIDLATEQSGALQVVSVGNEANNQDDAAVVVPADGVVQVPFTLVRYDWQSAPVTLVASTILWRRPEVALSFRVVDPEGDSAELGRGSGLASVGLARVDWSREDSPRGTAKFDIVLAAYAGLSEGEWTIEIESDDPEPVEARLTLYNDYFRGGMGTSFTNEAQLEAAATVGAYATADRALGACSYGTRQSYRGEELGALSSFSSRGPRVDGLRVVDLCAPGDNDILWAQSSRGDLPFGGYSFGGGTSASAPHVAGAIALLVQAAPWATADQLEDALAAGAQVDGFVSEPVPNHRWGFGKARVADALEQLPRTPEPEPEPDSLADPSPWSDDLTPDAGLPELERPAAARAGVEGGGCHCQTGAFGASQSVFRLFSL